MVEKIKETFRKNGWDFRLIKSQWPYALYELSGLFDWGGYVVGYEVHKLRKIPSLATFYGDLVKDYIRYPSNEEFGEYGWSYQDLEDAEIKYKALLEEK